MSAGAALDAAEEQQKRDAWRRFQDQLQPERSWERFEQQDRERLEREHRQHERRQHDRREQEREHRQQEHEDWPRRKAPQPGRSNEPVLRDFDDRRERGSYASQAPPERPYRRHEPYEYNEAAPSRCDAGSSPRNYAPLPRDRHRDSDYDQERGGTSRARMASSPPPPSQSLYDHDYEPPGPSRSGWAAGSLSTRRPSGRDYACSINRRASPSPPRNRDRRDTSRSGWASPPRERERDLERRAVSRRASFSPPPRDYDRHRDRSGPGIPGGAHGQPCVGQEMGVSHGSRGVGSVSAQHSSQERRSTASTDSGQSRSPPLRVPPCSDTLRGRHSSCASGSRQASHGHTIGGRGELPARETAAVEEPARDDARVAAAAAAFVAMLPSPAEISAAESEEDALMADALAAFVAML